MIVARKIIPAILVVLVIHGILPKSAHAQMTKLEEEQKLEQEFTNPLTTLPQVFIKDTYSPATYGTHVQTNTALLRAIIPRIPRYALLPFIQLIRPTIPLVTVPSSRGGSRTELGDIQVFDLAVLPWPSRQSGFAIGVGPTFVFPTATSRSAGQGSWQAGPSFAMAYTGIPWFLFGFIYQDQISFAYTSANRPAQNSMDLQPVVLIHLWRGFYLRSADATWTYDTHHHNPTIIPISAGVGRVLVRPGLPPLNFYIAGQWMAYRQFAPIAPQNSVIFGLTVAWPEIINW